MVLSKILCQASVRTKFEEEGCGIKKRNVLRLDMPVRWGSLYSMSREAVMYRSIIEKALGSAVMTKEEELLVPSNSDWELIDSVLELLELPRILTEKMSSSANPTYNL